MFTGVFKDRTNSRLGALRTPDLVLGKLLQARSLGGHQFQRKVSVGPFVVDYACLEKAVVIEIGRLNDPLMASLQTDARARFIEQLGYRLVHVSPKEILHQPAEVVARVRAALNQA